MGTFYAPNDYRNYIAHFGIKGMKWGVRRKRRADISGKARGRGNRRNPIDRDLRARRTKKWYAKHLGMAALGLGGGAAMVALAARERKDAAAHRRFIEAEKQKQRYYRDRLNELSDQAWRNWEAWERETYGR